MPQKIIDEKTEKERLKKQIDEFEHRILKLEQITPDAEAAKQDEINIEELKQEIEKICTKQDSLAEILKMVEKSIFEIKNIIEETFVIKSQYSPEEDFEFDMDNGTILNYIGHDTEVHIPKRILGVKVQSICKKAFFNNLFLTSLVIPDCVTKIEEFAFCGCEKLISVKLPKSLKIIENWTFNSCTNLKSIEIPENVTEISQYSFSGCTNLEEIIMHDNLISIGNHSFSSCQSIKSVRIPKGVKSIGSWAFCGCSNLTSVEIPDSVVSIGIEVFDKCEKLKSIVAHDRLSKYRVSIKNREENSNSTYVENISLEKEFEFDEYNGTILKYNGRAEKLQIPNEIFGVKVQKIGKNAFSYNTSLVSVVIPGSVTEIEEFAFSRCKKLVSVNIPDLITVIRQYSFYECESLKSIELHDNIIDIEQFSFYGCLNLKITDLPQSVKHIGINAFKDCLCTPKEVLINDNIKDLSRILISNINSRFNLNNTTKQQ